MRRACDRSAAGWPVRALLDVNVLLALLDADHVDHVRARTALAGPVAGGWASCPLTENGFVRIISQPRYPNPCTPAEAIALLARATGTAQHQRWADDVSLLDGAVVDPTGVLAPGQVTDVYLLALAVAHGGRLVTFDGGIPLAAVRGATTANLLVL